MRGVARFSETLDQRDAQLRTLLSNANKATTVLGERSNEVVSLVANTNALLVQLRTQSSALDQISDNLSAVAQQVKGFIADNRQTLKPALEKLNAALTIVDNRKERVQKAIKGLNAYALSLGESVSSGPYFKAYLANLLPGQFVQPFIDAAFSDLGLDPNVLLPSQLTDPQTGQPATPPLPMPYPRTGQGGDPRLTLPDAITGNPSDHQCGPAGSATAWPGLLSLSGAAARATSRRPAAGSPGSDAAGPASVRPHPAGAGRAAGARAGVADGDRPQGVGSEAFTKEPGSGVAALLAVVLVGGIVAVVWTATGAGRTHVTAYFDNSNGIYPGDNVVILGVPVGKIDKIEPQPDRVKVSFWYRDKYKVPADAKAVILSPSLVTVRAIQLTPAYTGGPAMKDHAVIPRERTAVPWSGTTSVSNSRSSPRRCSPPNPAASVRWAPSSTPRPTTCAARAPTSATPSSSCRRRSRRSATTAATCSRPSRTCRSWCRRCTTAATAAASEPEPGRGDEVAGQRSRTRSPTRCGTSTMWSATSRTFVAENREALGTTSDKLASVSNAVVESLDDIKQTLHIGTPAFQNFANIYQPANVALTGAIAVSNFANPVQFLCSAVQAASRLGAEQSAKLCVQYLAPILKNRQYNFPPLGFNPFVGRHGAAQ